MLLAAFAKARDGYPETSRAREHIRSALTGFRLNGIALDPTWCSPMGSESSPNVGDWSTLRSSPNLWHEAATEARHESMTKSSFLGYVWVETANESSPRADITLLSSSSTSLPLPRSFSKLADVPTAPFIPFPLTNRARTNSRSCMSISRSWA